MTAELWLAVAASGLYHGVSPGMGWPLAVSAGLIERSSHALVAALWQIGASLLVIGFGILRLVNPRHPRSLARIPPTQLGLWSFVVAIAHGAGFMLVPIYLELASGQIARLGSARPTGNMTVEQKVPLKGVKEKPRRAMINYYNDVLAVAN